MLFCSAGAATGGQGLSPAHKQRGAQGLPASGAAPRYTTRSAEEGAPGSVVFAQPAPGGSRKPDAQALARQWLRVAFWRRFRAA